MKQAVQSYLMTKKNYNEAVVMGVSFHEVEELENGEIKVSIRYEDMFVGVDPSDKMVQSRALHLMSDEASRDL